MTCTAALMKARLGVLPFFTTVFCLYVCSAYYKGPLGFTLLNIGTYALFSA